MRIYKRVKWPLVPLPIAILTILTASTALAAPGTLGICCAWGPGNWGPRPIVGGRCIEDPACADDFNDRLDEMIGLFEALELDVRSQSLYDVIAPDVLADPRKEYDRAAFFRNYRELLDWIAWRPDSARLQLR